MRKGHRNCIDGSAEGRSVAAVNTGHRPTDSKRHCQAVQCTPVLALHCDRSVGGLLMVFHTWTPQLEGRRVGGREGLHACVGL